ncbi:MAG: nucleotidyltransferase domain-containing protein [Nanoarchaeota archaeon]
MDTANTTSGNVINILFKSLFKSHTVSSIAKLLGMSRVGIWKTLKKLEESKFVILTPVGEGKTSTYGVTLNWDNVLVEKKLAVLLTEEAFKEERWRFNFAELERNVSFLFLFGSILHSPKDASDIDIFVVLDNKNKFNEVTEIISKIQKTQPKKIHFIDLTIDEFEKELNDKNKAYLDALSKGVVLFGQENFIRLIKRVQTK